VKKNSDKKNSDNIGKRVWLWVELKKKWKKKCEKKIVTKVKKWVWLWVELKKK